MCIFKINKVIRNKNTNKWKTKKQAVLHLKKIATNRTLRMKTQSLK